MRFIRVTAKNWHDAVLLKPAENQSELMRTDVMMHSLAKCYLFPGKYTPYVIEENGRYIGGFRFRTYVRGVNLISFFIDRNYQGRGLGRKAVEYFISWTRINFPSAREIEIWVLPENTVALRIYETLGFRFTGQVNADGAHYMELTL